MLSAKLKIHQGKGVKVSEVKQFKFVYTYANSYEVFVEAVDVDTAWEMFNQGKGLSEPVCVDSEMQDDVEVEEVAEEK